MGEKKRKAFDLTESKYGLLIADIISIILIIIVGLQIGVDYSIIIVYMIIVPYLILTKRKVMIRQFLIATLIALVWMLIAWKEYGYNQSFLTLNGFNLFPLFAWACGLFASYLIYSHYEHLFHKKGLLFKLLMYVTMYWPILIAIETIAYHIFNIRNLATAQYAGLPILDCMHAPLWMRMAYFTMGPIFFLACYLLKLENPNLKPHLERS